MLTSTNILQKLKKEKNNANYFQFILTFAYFTETENFLLKVL